MKTSLKSNTWSSEKLAALKICYEARVPLKLMADFFCKSETSISKMLTRSNIRPIGSQPRGRPGSFRSRYLTRQDVETLVSQRLQTSGTPDESSTYFLCDQREYPRPFVPLRRARPRPLESWTSLSHLIEDLTKTGKTITRVHNTTLLRQGFDYVVNGTPTKSMDLLRIANTERTALSLPRVFIEGMTDDC